MPLVPPDMGGESHAASFLNHELATFRPLTVRGLSMGRERLVVMNECRNLVALGWASVLIPVHFWPKRPSEISFLPFFFSWVIYMSETFRKSEKRNKTKH